MNRKIEYASFEVTSYCNLNCSFCNRDEVIKNPKHISLDSWKIILDKLKSYNLKEAKLQGLGEPFLHPNFSKLCKMYKETFPSSKIITATNCQYKITDNFREALKHLDMLYLSIDGYKDNYEKHRKPAKWDKLINYLEKLQTVNRHNCKIVCNYVVNNENVYDIPKIDELCKKYNIEELRLNIAQNWSEGESIIDDKETAGYKKEEIDYLKKNYSKNIKGKAPWTWSDCFWVDVGMYITAEGYVNMCAINTDPAPLGNIFKQDLNEIFDNKYYLDVKNGCKTDNPTKHCKNCSYRELSPLLNNLIN